MSTPTHAVWFAGTFEFCVTVSLNPSQGLYNVTSDTFDLRTANIIVCEVSPTVHMIGEKIVFVHIVNRGYDFGIAGPHRFAVGIFLPQQ